MVPILSHLSLPAAPAALPVVAFLAKATLLLLVALLAAIALRRASAGARHIVWVGALAALVLLPVLSRWMPWRLEIGSRELGAMMQVLPGGEPLAQTVSETPLRSGSTALREHQRETGSTPAPDAPSRDASRSQLTLPSAPAALSASTSDVSTVQDGRLLSTGTIWLALLSLWVAGACMLLARFVAGMFAVRRIVRGAHALESPDWTAPLWEVADRLDLAHAPRLLRSDVVSMPFACGLLRPTIVLPRDADTWTDDRRRAVLFHELAHVRRRDLVGHTLGRIACALYWFHPLAWTAARRLRAESERACDDLVLASGTRASEYADHLLQIVTQVRHTAAPAVALAMARRKEFEGRMLAILDPELKRTAPSRVQAAGLVLGLAAIAVSVSAMAPAGAQPEQQARIHESPAPELQVLPNSTTTPADTGEHLRYHKASVGKIVSSAVDKSVGKAIRKTVGPVVDQALSSFRDGRDDRDFDSYARTWDDMGRTIANAITSRYDVRSSSPHVDSAKTALLVQLLQSDSSAKVRRTAAWALAQSDDRSATAPLAAALEQDKSADVREMAAWGLGQGDDRAAIQALGDAVQRDADERVKATAAWALGQMGEDAATPALDAAMADPSARVRSRAAWALGQIEPKNAPHGLVTALRDSDAKVRLTAAWALGQIEDPHTLSALSSALSTEKDRDVREAELRAVLMLGDTSDAALKELLKSPDPDIRLRATRALAGYGTGSWPWPWPWPQPRPMP